MAPTQTAFPTTETDIEHAQKIGKKSAFHELFENSGQWNICILPKHYSDHSEIIEKFHVRNEDVWVVSYIKAGTTWCQEMSWLIGNDLDYEKAKNILPLRFPYFEFDAAWGHRSDSINGGKITSPTSMEIVAAMPSTRFIKTHLPFNLLPNQIQSGKKKPRMIYIARNPKDLCVSFYHHRVMTEGYDKSLSAFVDEFVDQVASSRYAPYWSHVRDFWERRNESNILFITYEDMKRDLSSVCQKVADFLGKTFTEESLSQLVEHLSFESMKNNPYVNYDEVTDLLLKERGTERKTHFMRKGKVGSWKEELSTDSVRKLDKWIEENRIPGLWDDIL